LLLFSHVLFVFFHYIQVSVFFYVPFCLIGLFLIHYCTDVLHYAHLSNLRENFLYIFVLFGRRVLLRSARTETCFILDRSSGMDIKKRTICIGHVDVHNVQYVLVK
jgi:hypothetical protein